MVCLRSQASTNPSTPAKAIAAQHGLEGQFITSTEITDDRAGRGVGTDIESTKTPEARTPIPDVVNARNSRLTTPAGSGRNTPARVKSPASSLPTNTTLVSLQKLLNERLPQSMYVAYEEILSTLLRRGAKEPNVRSNCYAALSQFLQANRQAVTLHNEYARTYNKQFEGKHHRFHLPVFGSLEAAGTEDGYVTGVQSRPQEDPELQNTTAQESSTGREAALSHKMNSAIDLEIVVMQKGSDGESDALLEGPILQLTEPGGLDDRNINEVAEKHTETGFKGANERTYQLVQGKLSGEREVVLQTQVSLKLAEDEQAQEVEAIGCDVVDTWVAEPLRAPTVLQGSAISVLETNAIADQAVDPYSDDPSATAEVVVEVREEENATSIANRKEHLPTPTPPETEPPANVAVAPFQSVPQKQSARSYLAWLHQRQTRFPTAAPNSSECIAIAKKLERLHAHVYDEILYHWGLETSSEWGDWYKKNRQQALGEDPRFDEETMGKWEAWLKEDKELKNFWQC